MKKILLATTAAVCAGGVASAEVSLSGGGELGLAYSKGRAAGDQAETTVIHAANVKFTLSGETDNEMIGVFGASFKLDANESVTAGELQNAFVVYVGSADGQLGKIEAGSNLDAADLKAAGLGDPGLDGGIGVDNIAESYYGGSSKSIRYEKAIDAAVLALSGDIVTDEWAFGGAYNISDQLTIGAGYGRNEVAGAAEGTFNKQNTMSFGMVGELGQFSAAVLFSTRETTVPQTTPPTAKVADTSAFGLGVGYSIGDTKFNAIYAQSGRGGPAANVESGWGVGVSQDLGGGLSLVGGFGNVNDVTKANAGFTMSF